MLLTTEPRAVESVGRLVSLDVFRGMTVAGMILVTDPGTYSAVYSPLSHALWNGATATDMIFPSFLFIVGVSITLSFAARAGRGDSLGKLAVRVVRRTVLLILLGLLVNGFPDFQWHTLRLPGILQRIGLCYFCAGLLYLGLLHVGVMRRRGAGAEGRTVRVSVLAGVAATLLAGYWVLLKCVPVPGIGAGHLDSFGNLSSYIDRAVFGTNHLWAYGTTPGMGVTYDSEGLLSTLPAIAITLMGILAGEWMRTSQTGWRKAAGLTAAGVLLVASGLALSPLLPLNKRILTSTFGLLSGGVSVILFAFFYATVDLLRSRWWTLPGMIFGTNAIFAFTLSGVITTTLDRVHPHDAGGKLTNLHHWANDHLFATWLTAVHGSLAYAIVIVALNALLVYPLFQRRIFLRL